MFIAENYKKLREQIPSHLQIILAGKTRTKDEILKAINAGTTVFGARE